MERDLHYTRDEVRDLDLLDLSSHRMRLDLLTLHARVAALTEHAERVGAVLRALADAMEEGVDRLNAGDDFGEVYADVLDDVIQSAGGIGFAEGITALRTLAGEASR